MAKHTRTLYICFGGICDFDTYTPRYVGQSYQIQVYLTHYSYPG